jgi:hypothetical protein
MSSLEQRRLGESKDADCRTRMRTSIGQVRLVLHERLYQLSPFTLRSTNFVLDGTCHWPTSITTIQINPVLLILVEIEQPHIFGRSQFSFMVRHSDFQKEALV